MLTKAILTGGGRATRLRPITTTINKHLIPLANEPMIFHAIAKVAAAGIKEIFINLNPDETELQKAVGNGDRWGVRIEYFVQDGGPRGIAHVVKCAERFIGDDPFLFYLSDNIILGELTPIVEEFNAGAYDCLLAFAKVPDPQRFGVPIFGKDNELVDIIEKPSDPPNNFAVTGIYLYGSKIFFEAFDHIKPSARKEYEISSINSYLLKTGRRVGWREITGWWKDTGKPDDLLLANKLLLDKIAPERFKKESPVAGAKVKGNVELGKNTAIGKKVSLVGPVMIGEDCVLENCVIGPHVTIGRGTAVKNSQISESILFGHSMIDGAGAIVDSIIGEHATIQAHPKQKQRRLIVGDHTFLEL